MSARCAICGKTKGPENEWFVVREARDLFCVEPFSKQPKFRTWRKVCSKEHVAALLDSWLGGK